MGDASTPRAVLYFVHLRIGETATPCNGLVTPRTLCLSSTWELRMVLTSMGHREAPSHRHSVQLFAAKPVCATHLPLLTSLTLPTCLCLLGLFPAPFIFWSLWAIKGLPWPMAASLPPTSHDHLLPGSSHPFCLYLCPSFPFVEGQQSHWVWVTLMAPL